MQAQFAPRGIVIVEQAEAGVEKRATALGEGREEFFGGELGDQRVPQFYEGGELRGIGPQALQLPQAVKHGAGFLRKTLEASERGLIESAAAISIEIDDADGSPFGD